MNDRIPMQATERLAHVLAAQRRAFDAQPCPAAEERRALLRTLKRQLARYQDVLAEAIDRDFAGRAHAETKMLDVLPTTLEINHALMHLDRWMRPQRRSAELLFLSNRLHVAYQPKGVVGVIATWNFPLYLSLGPLAAALAAGNRVMLKMPEATPATNAVLRAMLAQAFTEDRVAIFGEELEDPSAFSALPFDHLIFTGSPAVGRLVMRQAAENLTPVTLELGGKSPALVLRGASVRNAARRVAHGKGVNCGQICVAPDYALVPRESAQEFTDEVRASFVRMYGAHVDGNAEYTSLASDRHAARVKALLDDARAKGATVTACAQWSEARRMPLHVVTGCTSSMAILREEIFGPILPVVPYDTEAEALAFIGERPRPLALYCFAGDAASRERVLRATHSGGVTVNDWAWHVINHDAPFGGIGNSGMGTYHGEEGFRELSHARTVFRRHRFFPIGLFYPPYGNLVQRLALRLFIGRADRSLKHPF